MAPPSYSQFAAVQVQVQGEQIKPPHCGSAHLLDADEFRRQGHQVVDFIADYYARMDEYPVHPSVTPGFLRRQLPEEVPLRPEPGAFAAALRDVRDLMLPGMTHWQSPRHFAHFPASGSTVGALGEALTAGINVVPFTAATELEMVVVDWLGKALHLPESLLFCGGGGGTLLGTSCEAILSSRRSEAAGRGSATSSSTAPTRPTSPSPRPRASPASRATTAARSRRHLRAAMRADADAGLVPLFVCATVGTTQTTAVDPVRELCAVAAAHGAWVHVDAAYAGSALVCPELAHVMIAGAEAVDSFSMNAHKWLLANNDCCALWVRKPSLLVAALGTESEYILKDAAAEGGDVVDYKDWSVTLTRRFHALKL
ncbi:hypothetical protein EJB05_43546, partial [Eragrostis curvula]